MGLNIYLASVQIQDFIKEWLEIDLVNWRWIEDHEDYWKFVEDQIWKTNDKLEIAWSVRIMPSNGTMPN